ncbi:MAG: magnesium transporter [Pirellulaceae bacterium]|nr:magnesium transporter [Planctomycetales bacterium]MCA9162313.1 magnesium transporter [Planctomycetales bacterium]MCA9202124.1 magnesium transporter [Planctomycetales bacterium]MCA9209818.1 magnesium transporter [Planctomycetales bacterium]MCA9220950.1 magnesium transporter [Planctomycetales bacterium]
MLNPLLLPEIRTMLAQDDQQGLTEIVTELHAATVAEFGEGLTVEETWALLRHADVARQAEIFAFFPEEKQVELVDGVGRERMSRLLEAMSHDDRVDLLQLLDEEVVESLLPLVAKADREDIRRLLSYPEHSAGSVMTTDYATLPPDVTVQESINRLRQQASQKETIYYIYVVDAERHLIGFVSLRDLILAKPNSLVEDIMQEDVVSVRADQDQEDVARTLAKYDFIAMPVVDEQGRIIGIVTHDDVLDVLVEEATEDALHMGGVGAMEENYLDVPFTTVWRKRSMWLSCLFVAELFTFTALAQYEDAISSIIALSLFVPLCISTGGNSGSQAATLITRAMALGQITPGQWWRVLRHELLMGLALGLTLGVIGFVRASLTPASVLGDADRWVLALVIGQSVASICLWGTLVGSMLPLVFEKLGFDPGYASSPFVATFVDVTGIVIYFTIAKTLLLG